MPLKIMSLNVGRMLQPRTKTFLERLSGPDVLLLQDFPFRSLPLLERYPHVAFAPMTNHIIWGHRAIVGIALLSKYLLTSVAYYTTWGNGVLKDLEGINDRNERHLGAESDKLVEATEDRVAICTCVRKDADEYNLVTTHGMWARNGVANDVQRKCTHELVNVLKLELMGRPDLVLAGDLNCARGGEIYNMLTAVMQDEVPQNVVGTLDPDHPLSQKGIDTVVDYIMSARDGRATVSDVGLTSGISDHQALTATITMEDPQ